MMSVSEAQNFTIFNNFSAELSFRLEEAKFVERQY